MIFNNLKYNNKKKTKLILKLKKNYIINCKKIKSKIFYNLTFLYLKNNFLLINTLINFNIKQFFFFKNNFTFINNKIYNDSFILKYLKLNFDNKYKINFNKKSISINSILYKILFLNKSFDNFKSLKNEKQFLKKNILKIFFFLFYYYFKNLLYYNFFLTINNKKKKLPNIILFLKDKLKNCFSFFLKNVVFFLYKFSLIKEKKINLIDFFFKKRKKRKRRRKKRKKLIVIKKKKKTYLNKILFHKKKNFLFKKLYKKKKNYKCKKIDLIKKKNLYKYKKINYIKKKNLYNNNTFSYKKKQNFNSKEKRNRIYKKNFFFKRKKNKKIKKNKIFYNILSKNIVKYFILSLNKKKKKIFSFKQLFFKKILSKRIFESSFKKDDKLNDSTYIFKNNKKFKFLTFPMNSVCKFFFKTTMYNIFMTLIVLPLNLTIISCSGGQFNILSKRRDRGSINSLKYMTKIIALKIYQSNLNFIIFCPYLITNRNKKLIKTIFYLFKILNKSPITKIYLYRPVIRNGIRAKKLPRK